MNANANAVTKQSEVDALHDIMFQLLCLVPICVSVIQIIFWRFYKLRNSHATESKYLEA